MAVPSSLFFSASVQLLPVLCRSAYCLSQKLNFSFSPVTFRSLRTVLCRSGESGDGGYFGGEPYGPYPWESFSSSDEQSCQWVPEDRITLFTSEGLVHIGGSLIPRHFPTSDKKYGRSKVSQRSQRFLESDYMDPNQVLCLGALFDIAATNVVAAEKASKEGLQEKLKMTVAVPLLWGIPSASETLRYAVRSGGGIVERVYWQWDFL